MRATFMTNMAELEQATRVFPANVLIVGPLAASQRDEILQTVKRQSGLDVLHAQRYSVLVLPTHGEAIVALDDVCDLTQDDQHRLLEWITRQAGRIVSFASRSPYAMVCAGAFVEQLYYHLNMICIVLADE